MKIKILVMLVVGLVASTANIASAAYIDFTGGTAYLWDGTTFTPDGGTYVEGVDYYVENGFKLDFIVSNETDSFSTIIGDYYGGDNDVIHGHWSTGDYGDLIEIRVSKLDGTSFDLNYFEMTSNTDTGGGAASGNELAYINASEDGSTISYSQLLPTDDWGWSGTNPKITLGSEFDSILFFSFTVSNAVDCFGMDNFYIDEPAPGVPSPCALLLGGIGMSVTTWIRKRRYL